MVKLPGCLKLILVWSAILGITLVHTTDVDHDERSLTQVNTPDDSDEYPKTGDIIIAPSFDGEFVTDPRLRKVHAKLLNVIDTAKTMAIEAIDRCDTVGISVVLFYKYYKRLTNSMKEVSAESNLLTDVEKPPAGFYTKTADALDKLFDNSNKLMVAKAFISKKYINREGLKNKIEKIFVNLHQAIRESPASIYLDYVNVQFGDVMMWDEFIQIYTMMRVLGYNFLLQMAQFVTRAVRNSAEKRKREELMRKN